MRASALDAAREYRAEALAALRWRLDHGDIDQEQRAAHGFAWVATSVAALKALHAWLEANGGANPVDATLAQIAWAETIAQLVGGLPMGQNEVFRPVDLGLGEAARALEARCGAVLSEDNVAARAALTQALCEGRWPSETFRNAELDAIRHEFRRFTAAEIPPHAHKWHLANALIPDATVRAMAELGTFTPDRWRNVDFLERRLVDLPALAHRVVIGAGAPADAMAWNDLPRCDPPEVEVDPDAEALRLYTSGTTGAPKGVRHSSNRFIAEIDSKMQGRAPTRSWLSPWPSGHVAGTINTFGHALLGRPTVLMDDWDATAAAMLIERFAVEQTSGTPYHLSGIMEAAARDGRDLSSMDQFLVGATTVRPALVKASEAAGIRCCRCYGSTEMPTFSQRAPSDPLEKRLNTDGRPNGVRGAHRRRPGARRGGGLLRGARRPRAGSFHGLQRRQSRGLELPAGRLVPDRRDRLHRR